MTEELKLPELPEPSIRVTHETDTVYCADVPADQVPPHDNYWSEARVLSIRDSGIRYGMEMTAARLRDALEMWADDDDESWTLEIRGIRKIGSGDIVESLIALSDRTREEMSNPREEAKRPPPLVTQSYWQRGFNDGIHGKPENPPHPGHDGWDTAGRENAGYSNGYSAGLTARDELGAAIRAKAKEGK
jgi:hypothetical protein